MPLRTFLAVELELPTVAALVKAQEQLAYFGDKVKWVERVNLHITLNFLGDVADEDAVEVCRRAAQAAGRVEPFEFGVTGLVCSPTHGALRMVWANVDDPSGMMSVLHDELAKGFAQMGLRQENREFRPHITVARIKYVANQARFRGAVRMFSDVDFGRQHCEEVVAFTSLLTDEGPVYTALSHAELGTK